MEDVLVAIGAVIKLLAQNFGFGFVGVIVVGEAGHILHGSLEKVH